MARAPRGPAGRKKKRTPLEQVVVPAVAGAAMVAGVGQGLVERARHNGRVDDNDDNDERGRATIERQPGPPDDEPPQKKTALDKIADRVPILRTPVAVQKRFGELHGNNLAASVTLQAFLSLFPLLLVGVAVIGFVAGKGTDVAGNVIRSLGLTGDAATSVRDAVATAEGSRRAASIIGLAGLLWSGLGLVAALQYAYDTVWHVEARGLKDKAVGLLWLAGAALLFVGSAAVTTVLRWLPGILSPVGVIVAFGVSLLLWIWTSKVLPNVRTDVRTILPGAIVGAIGLEILKVIGAFYVPKLVSSSSQLYGSIGIVFAILAWLLLFSRLIVYSAVINVVLDERRAGTDVGTVGVPHGVSSDTTPEVRRAGTVPAEDAAPVTTGR